MPAVASAPANRRPAADEHAPYYGRYIGLVPDGDIVGTLEAQLAATLSLLSGLTDEQANHRYAPDKWSVKQSLGHVIDAERVFSYRAVVAARGDAVSLPGFEQDDWVATGQFDARSLESLLEEFQAVRRSSIALFGSLSADAWDHRVVASGNPVSARALAWIIAGHELHHRQLLRDKYLPQA
jgi:uncharacterized damage-inducible protein DinB